MWFGIASLVMFIGRRPSRRVGVAVRNATLPSTAPLLRLMRRKPFTIRSPRPSEGIPLKRLLLIVASVLAFVGLTALPAAATSQGGGPINLPYCPGTFWGQNYGPDYGGSGTSWGSAFSYQSPTQNCWNRIIIYYTDGSGGHTADSGWYSYGITWSIPAGAHMVYSDHNWWNLQYNYVSGYRRYATWHA